MGADISVGGCNVSPYLVETDHAGYIIVIVPQAIVWTGNCGRAAVPFVHLDSLTYLALLER